MIGIYKITSPKGKIYIGQSIDIYKRFRTYKSLSCKSQTILYRSFLKYGVENHNFEIIIECSASEMNDLERYYQDLYSAMGKNGLNCKLTKTNDRSGKHSEETKLKLSIANSKPTGRKMSEENKQKLRVSNSLRKGLKGHKMPEHLKEKLLSINTGNKYNLGNVSSEYKKSKISEANKGNKYCLGRKLSEVHIHKLYKSNKGRSKTDDEKNKMSESSKKIIINLETGIFHFGIKEISDTYEVKFGTITHRLNGRYKNNTSFIYV